MTVYAALDVLPGITDRVEIVSTLDDGRLIVRFDSGAELTVPPHLVSPLHRGGDLDTARAAAAAFTGAHLNDTQFTVLDAIVRSLTGLADHQHAALNGLGQDTAGKRRLELQRKGLIVQVEGERFTTPRGKDAAIWQATNAGRELHARLVHARALAASS